MNANRNDTESGYGIAAIVLHWLMAAMIAVLLPLGLWMTGLDYYDPWYRRAPDLHRAIGVLFGLLLLLRLLLRARRTPPAPLTRSPWERSGARLGHTLLYLVPLGLVISGYLISTADGRPVDVFGWFALPATLYGIDGQADIAGDIHFALAMILLALVAIHAGAAIRHHFVLGDDTLRRMLRPRPPKPE